MCLIFKKFEIYCLQFFLNFWFNSLLFREHSLNEINPLKFI